MNKITFTLPEDFKAGDEITITINPEIKQWQPESGDYFINHNGMISTGISSKPNRLFGIERKEIKHAEYLLERTRKANRLSAWVDEHGGYEFKVNNSNHYIYYLHRMGIWTSTYVNATEQPDVVYMNKEQAEELVDKLNSGEVVL